MKIKVLNDLIKRIREKNFLSMREKREFISEIKENLKPGMKVICHQMNDDPYPVPSGTKGTVVSIDDLGQVHVNWETGGSLALVLEIDEFEVIDNV